MIYRVLFILILIVSSCGKKTEESKPYNITITGVVSDQVTGQTVEGVTVTIGRQVFGFQTEGLKAPMKSMLTGPDGSYELITSSQTYVPGSISVGTYMSQCIAVIANKTGYVGSIRREIQYYGAGNTVLNFQLYHSSELYLHIRNDTTNSIDKVNIKLIRSPTKNSLTILTLVCEERKLDSTYVIKNLFGNLEYSLQVFKSGVQPQSLLTNYSVTPLPDVKNNFEILF
jgi:hypothetical protein